VTTVAHFRFPQKRVAIYGLVHLRTFRKGLFSIKLVIVLSRNGVSLCLIKDRDLKAYGSEEVEVRVFLIVAVDKVSGQLYPLTTGPLWGSVRYALNGKQDGARSRSAFCIATFMQSMKFVIICCPEL
jgi:hypothetical protein